MTAAIERGFLAANRWALILLLAAMSVIVFANVLIRYLTNASIPWSEEVARHMMIWLTFLGAGPVLRAGGHIAVESLQDALPRPAAIGVRVAVAACMLVFFAVIVWFGTAYALRATSQVTAATQIPFAWIYAAIPAGGVLLVVHFALVLRGYVRDRQFAPDDHFDATASASI